MNQKIIKEIIKKIIDKSKNNNKFDYLKCLYQESTKVINNYNLNTEKEPNYNEKTTEQIIDEIIKKILKDLKNNISIKKYDNILIKLEHYNNQKSYDYTISLIKTYYKNEFKTKEKEYKVIDIMNTLVEQDNHKELFSKALIFNDIIAILFKIYYILIN